MNMIAEGFLKQKKEINLENIKLVETSELYAVVRWLKYFKMSYQYECKKINKGKIQEALKKKLNKCLVISINGMDIGFVFLNKVSNKLNNANIWALEVSYINPAFRGEGIYKKVIELLNNQYGMHFIHIEKPLAAKYVSFYKSLSFGSFIERKGAFYLVNDDSFEVAMNGKGN